MKLKAMTEESNLLIAEWEAKENIRIKAIPDSLYDNLVNSGKIIFSEEQITCYMAKARDQIKTDPTPYWCVVVNF